ncbi:MAG: hypothetical protein PHR92_05440 [Lachnospiraceae bacterium]|nr:hypothetical protein [Lachnospiraceae bacterium]
MSKFSEKCKALLEENGTNVYRLSKSASLEHTTLQRMVTGKRRPNIEFVRNFCRELRIPHADELQLLQLYRMEEMGETTWRNRQSIIQVLNHLSDLEKSASHIPESVPAVPIISQADRPIAVHTYEVELLLYSILTEEFVSEEKSWVYTNCSLHNGYFSHILMLLCQHYPKKINVEQFVSFQLQNDGASYNLEMLSQILPLAFSESISYQVYYSYTRNDLKNELPLLFPYYVITPHHVLLLSSDLSEAVLHSETEIVTLYKKTFEKARNNGHPLIQSFSDPDEAAVAYLGKITENDTNSYFHAMEYAPCPMDMAPLETFLEAASACPPKLQEIAGYYVKTIQNIKNYHVQSCFTLPGLDTFCRTGRVSGNIGAFLPPASVPQRIEYLKNILSFQVDDDIDRNHGMAMIAPEIFHIPSNLCIEMMERTCLNFLKIEKDFHFVFVFITESSICDAFYEFMSARENADYILSPEESKETICELLNKLEAMQAGQTHSN